MSELTRKVWFGAPDFVMKLVALVMISATLFMFELLFGWKDVWHFLTCWHTRHPGFVNPFRAWHDFIRKIE